MSSTKPANTGRTRDGKGRWLRGGPSPNPTGRPATPAEVQAIWDAHTEEAALKIIEVMRTAPEVQDQLRAAMHVLDRRFGRPAQSLDVTARQVPPGAVGGNPDQARARLEALIAAERDEQSGATAGGAGNSGNDIRALPDATSVRMGSGGQPAPSGGES
jgi:hypothetical protein